VGRKNSLCITARVKDERPVAYLEPGYSKRAEKLKAHVTAERASGKTEGLHPPHWDAASTKAAKRRACQEPLDVAKIKWEKASRSQKRGNLEASDFSIDYSLNWRANGGDPRRRLR